MMIEGVLLNERHVGLSALAPSLVIVGYNFACLSTQ